MSHHTKSALHDHSSGQQAPLPSGELAFEKSRLDHCIRLFEEENSRREKFEKTAQYYLSFLTIFLGALFLKIDFLETLVKLLKAQADHRIVVWVVYLSIATMLISLLLGLISVLECMRIRRYKREFPKNPSLQLFVPSSFYTGHEDSTSFLKVTAMTYIAAIEANFHTTERKGLWIERAAFFMLTAVLSLFVLLTAITYLMLM